MKFLVVEKTILVALLVATSIYCNTIGKNNVPSSNHNLTVLPELTNYIEQAEKFFDHSLTEYLKASCEQFDQKKCEEFGEKIQSIKELFKEKYLTHEFLCQTIFQCSEHEVNMIYPRCFSCLTIVHIMKDDEFMEMNRDTVEELCSASNQVSNKTECIKFYDGWMDLLKKMFQVNPPVKVCQLSEHCKPSELQEHMYQFEIQVVGLKDPKNMEKIKKFAHMLKDKLAEYMKLPKSSTKDIKEDHVKLSKLQVQKGDSSTSNKDNTNDSNINKNINMDQDIDENNEKDHDMGHLMENTMLDILSMKLAEYKEKHPEKYSYLHELYKNYMDKKMKDQDPYMHYKKKELLKKLMHMLKDSENTHSINKMLHMLKELLMWNKHYKQDGDSTIKEYMKMNQKYDQYSQDKEYQNLMSLFRTMQMMAKDNGIDIVNMFKIRINSPDNNINTDLFKNMKIRLNNQEIDKIKMGKDMYRPNLIKPQKLGLMMKETSNLAEEIKHYIKMVYEKIMQKMDSDDLEEMVENMKNNPNYAVQMVYQMLMQGMDMYDLQELVEMVQNNLDMEALKDIMQMIFPDMHLFYARMKEMKSMMHMMVQKMKDMDLDEIKQMVHQMYAKVASSIDEERFEEILEHIKNGDMEMFQELLSFVDSEKMSKMYQAIKEHPSSDDFKHFLGMLYESYHSMAEVSTDHSDQK